MRTPFLVTLRGRRNTIESVESGLAVHLAEQVKRVAARPSAAQIQRRLRPGLLPLEEHQRPCAGPMLNVRTAKSL